MGQIEEEFYSTVDCIDVGDFKLIIEIDIFDIDKCILFYEDYVLVYLAWSKRKWNYWSSAWKD